MELAPWLVGGSRNIRSRRFINRSKQEDYIKLDLNLDPYENIKEILKQITSNDLSEAKILNYLNNLVKLIQHLNSNISLCKFTLEEILYCLRVALTHDSTTIRAGTYRAIRHLILDPEDIHLFNKQLIPFMLIRSLDLAYKNDAERVEAIKLMRKILLTAPNCFNAAFARYLVSLCNGGIEEKDRMLRVSMATLSELGILNPQLFIVSGGVAAITRNLLECQTPKISESLCGVLLLLLDRPVTRNQAAIDLHCVAAPYCDFHYKHGWMDKNRDERELRFNCSRLALLSILRSWPGILHFCSPKDNSGLKAIVDVLYLNQLEVRKAVLDLLYELLNLPQPEWTDELSVALSAVDPVEPQASWRLGEGFVAAEGRSILPHLAGTTPNISDMHLSLLLYCFLETGLLTALSEVIATSDTFISVRATVLLGELLRLIQVFLPPKCCNVTPPLPNLIFYATTNRPQALQAITALQQLHKLLKKRPASFSIYLDFILRSGSAIKKTSAVERMRPMKVSSSRSKLSQLVSKDSDDAIKESGVLSKRDATSWNWSVVQMILKRESDFSIDTSDANHRSFLKRLVEYFMPSNKGYSHMDLLKSYKFTIAGIDLIDCLVEMSDCFCQKLLHEWFSDIARHIDYITTGKSAHDCLFSPQHMATTQCQTYFLFIGRLNSYTKGNLLYENLGFFEQLSKLATTTNHDCYVKLIVSSLDYNDNQKSVQLLASVLKSANESSRLYATQILLVLLRAGIPRFSEWGIRLLAERLKDPARPIYLSALSTLHEACEVLRNLEQLIDLNPEMLHLGEKGLLLLIRFLSIPKGFERLNRNGFVANELRRWDEYYNSRYVFLIEGETSDALTLHQRGEDGRYDKRTSQQRSSSKRDLFLPPHIYGQLCRHDDGLRLLIENSYVNNYIQVLETATSTSETEEDIVKIKASLWALGHLGSSIKGHEYIQQKGVLPFVVNLAESSEVYSIRATAFYALGLIATTETGADHLTRLSWVCTRHDRHNRWPIISEENDDFQLNANVELHSLSSDYARQEDIKHEDTSVASDDRIDKFIINRKSVTLPYHSAGIVQHMRSLSESKTFEIAKAHKSDLPRHRDNSVTESTTSGVSSCESALGKSTINDSAPPTLTPIPSNSSLHTATICAKKRRNSESGRGGFHSNRSTISPASSSSSQLSMQDHIGYQTIRQLKMQSCNEYTLSPALTRIQSLNRYKMNKPEPGGQSSLLNYLMEGLSLTSLSSVKKFQVLECRKEEQVYLGITLPIKLTNLFPEKQTARKLSFSSDGKTLNDSDSDNSVFSTSTEISGVRRNIKQSEHDVQTCLSCTLRETCETNDLSASVLEKDSVRLKILGHIEMLANPVPLKTTKQGLLNLKQKHPKEFQDLCLYSDVCRMLTENSYCLQARRFLQDLFYDVSFEVLSKNVLTLLEMDRTNLKAAEKIRQKAQTKKFSEVLSEERNLELSKDSSFQIAAKKVEDVVLRCDVIKASSVLHSVREEFHNPSSGEETTRSTSTVIVCNNERKNNANNSPGADNKTEDKAPRLSSNILTLDQLKFTYNENKFPITRGDDKNVVK